MQSVIIASINQSISKYLSVHKQTDRQTKTSRTSRVRNHADINPSRLGVSLFLLSYMPRSVDGCSHYNQYVRRKGGGEGKDEEAKLGNNDAGKQPAGYSSSSLFDRIMSSVREDIQRHRSIRPSTGLKAYRELESMSRRRLLTITAVVR